jgi:pimeloyl-ACP methyl ester carboxylesterase
VAVLVSKTYWGGAPFHMREPPEGVQLESLLLKAADYRELHALWWRPQGVAAPRSAIVAMHPRVDFTRHYAFSALLQAGFGCLGANTRSPNNDLDTVHEEIVLDLGACVRFLRSVGVDNVILLGNSGGGSLAALYQSEAERAPGERIKRTPAGAPTRLPVAELPPADAMIYVAAHPGQGRVLGECIDAAVVDESEPLKSEPMLDMYDPRNGFAKPPGWSEYDASFVDRYRVAQRQRVARLDDIAQALVREGQAARKRLKGKLGDDERRDVERRRHHEPVMVIHRTMANLHYTDRRQDPSERSYGSLLSERPDLMNHKLLGFARVCTPRAWLSTWSSLSSNADMLKTLPSITSPTLMVNAGRDREIYPVTHIAPMVAAIAAEDRTVVTVAGARHYFEPDFGEQRAPHRDELMRVIVAWIRERYE